MLLQREPIKKRSYRVENINLELLHKHLLRKFNMFNLNIVENPTSVVDAFITSASTYGNVTIPMEYKNRTCSIGTYESCMLEKFKHEQAIYIAKAMNAPFYLYITEFLDCVLIYCVTPKHYLQWQTMNLPYSSANSAEVAKEITFLPYANADFIFSKRSLKRRDINELNTYINRRNNFTSLE